MEKFIEMSSQKNHEEGYKRIVNFLTNETTKYELMQFLNIDKKYADEYTHELLVEKIIRGQVDWKTIIDKFEIPDVQVD